MKNDTPTPLSLSVAFESTFHNKYSFDDFLSLVVENEYETFSIHDRSIHKASVKLKKYLRFLNNFVFNFAQVSSVVHSYKKNRSPYTAVLPHSKNSFFFKTDIQNFFNSITTSDIKNVIDNNLDRTPINDISNYKSNILNMVSVDNTLPVGFPTSPNITNTFLYSFDNELEKYCQNNDIIYTRYSDDIILSSKKKHHLNNIDSVVAEYLKTFSSKNFNLSPHKTKLTHKGNKVILLGMVLLPSGKFTVDSKIKTQIESLFHFYINDKEKFESCLNNFFDGKLSSVSGRLNYINTIDESYTNKLRKKYGNFIVDYFYNKPAE